MKKNLVQLFLAGVIGLFFVATASATLISGDFRTVADLPTTSTFPPRVGPLVYQDLGAAINGGVELTEVDLFENSTPWYPGLVYMDYNPINNILTLDSQDQLDFQIFDASITNILFDGPEIITGITMILNELTNPTLIPTLSFTDNSIHIGYDIGLPDDVFYFTGGSAEFQVTTYIQPVVDAPIPEPSTMVLLGGGLVGLAWYRRKRC